MILNLHNVKFLKDPELEQQVRKRMNDDGIDESQFGYLAAKPYPQPPWMHNWLHDQFDLHSNSYMLWKGWVLFKNQEDALMFSFAFPFESMLT